MSEDTVVAETIPQIFAPRVRPAEYMRNTWVATVEETVTREDVLKPEFWKNISIQFRPSDLVDVRWDDEKYFGQYYVTHAGRTFAKLKELQWYDLTQEDVKHNALDDYIYKWRGPHYKHCIVRVADQTVMTEGHDSKVDALKWLTENAHGFNT